LLLVVFGDVDVDVGGGDVVLDLDREFNESCLPLALDTTESTALYTFALFPSLCPGS